MFVFRRRPEEGWRVAMDLVAIMNERLRHQGVERRAANLKLGLLIAAAVVSLTEAILSFRASLHAADCIVSANAVPNDACNASPIASFLWKALCWAVGNACLIGAMNIAMRDEARLSALGRAARLWIPAREAPSLDTPTGALGRVAAHPLLMAAYFSAAVLVFISIAGSGVGFSLCVAVQLAQFAIFCVKCYAWHRSTTAVGT